MNRLVSSSFARVALTNNLRTGVAPVRSFASRSDDGNPIVTLTDDGKTIVCLHPEKKHPYEHTLPFVEEKETGVLKFENVVKGKNMFYADKKLDYLSIEEVQALTYTPKWVWRRKRFEGIQLRPDHPRKGV